MADLRGVPLGGTVALRRRASSPCLKVGTQAPQTPWRTVINRAFEYCYVASGRASGSLRVTRTLNATVPSLLAAAVNLARFGVLGLRQSPDQTWVTTTI
jgi:hypothetical protein